MSGLWRDNALKRTLAACVLGLYLVASLGIVPSPALIARWCGRLSSEQYPCQDHGCGCASAHQCWTSCCCFTPHQRLTWAIRRGVTPPPSVHVTDEEWIAAANDVTPDSAHCGLCVAGIKSDLERGVARGDDTDTSSRPSVPFPSISAKSCKGLKEILAFSLPPTAPARLTALLDPPPLIPCFDRPEDDRVPTRPLDIEAPPPRVVASALQG